MRPRARNSAARADATEKVDWHTGQSALPMAKAMVVGSKLVLHFGQFTRLVIGFLQKFARTEWRLNSVRAGYLPGHKSGQSFGAHMLHALTRQLTGVQMTLAKFSIAL
jgi:hypothetical protein